MILMGGQRVRQASSMINPNPTIRPLQNSAPRIERLKEAVGGQESKRE